MKGEPMNDLIRREEAMSILDRYKMSNFLRTHLKAGLSELQSEDGKEQVMVCPFLKETITVKTEDTESVKEIYCDCYENECPYYYRDNFDKDEGCRRTEE